jgi:hypothetical protein
MLLASPRKPTTRLSRSICRSRILPASMSSRTVPLAPHSMSWASTAGSWTGESTSFSTRIFATPLRTFSRVNFCWMRIFWYAFCEVTPCSYGDDQLSPTATGFSGSGMVIWASDRALALTGARLRWRILPMLSMVTTPKGMPIASERFSKPAGGVLSVRLL